MLYETSWQSSHFQITDEVFIEIISNILNSGEVTDLYKAHEFEEVKWQTFLIHFSYWTYLIISLWAES